MNADGSQQIVAGRENAYLLGYADAEPNPDPEIGSTVTLSDPEGGKLSR